MATGMPVGPSPRFAEVEVPLVDASRVGSAKVACLVAPVSTAVSPLPVEAVPLVTDEVR